MDGCGLSREEIAGEMSRLVGEEVSIHTLNNYLAQGRNSRRFPAEYLAVLATRMLRDLVGAWDTTGVDHCLREAKSYLANIATMTV